MHRFGPEQTGQVEGAFSPVAEARPPLVESPGSVGASGSDLFDPEGGAGPRGPVGAGPFGSGSAGSDPERRGGAGLRGRWLAPLLLLLPAALLLLFVFYMPLGTVLLQALETGPGGRPDPAAGAGLQGLGFIFSSYSFARFKELVGDPYIRRLIGFTARQALLSTLLSIAVGVPLAYVLANRSFRGKAFVSSLVMVPFVMPAVTVALGFLLMFGANGWLNNALDALFGFRLQVLHSLWAIVLAHAFFNGPLVARMTQGAWERLDPALEESARTLGASPWVVWRDVTSPALLPGLLSGALLAFVYCFMSFPIVLALGGARFSTLEVEIYTMIRVLLDYETGAALAGLQALISLGFAYVMLRAEGVASVGFSSARARPTAPLFRRRSRAGRRFAPAPGDGLLLLFLAMAALFFVGPVAGIVVDGLRGPDGTFTLAAFERVLAPKHDIHLGGPPLRAVLNSVRFGLIAATTSLAAGASFVYGTVRFVRRRLPFLETLVMAPVAVSSVALAYGMLLAFRRPPLSLLADDWRIPLVHAVLAFPFVVRAFRPVLEGVDGSLVEAARTLGAGRWRAFVDVELPMALTGLLVAFALSFGLSVSETSAALMLSRPDHVTMPVSVYRFLSSRDFGGASAMAVVLMAVTGGVFFLAEALARWSGARRPGGGRAGRAADRGTLFHGN